MQILISGSFENLSLGHASIVEHLKHEKDNLVSINDISKNTNLVMPIPNLGERRHLYTRYTLKKAKILISGSFEILSFSHESIVENFKKESDNFDSIHDISNNTNLKMTIPNLGERRHFCTVYTLKKVQILILESFQKLSFSNVQR